MNLFSSDERSDEFKKKRKCCQTAAVDRRRRMLLCRYTLLGNDEYASYILSLATVCCVL
jgi:hypothetical protein